MTTRSGDQRQTGATMITQGIYRDSTGSDMTEIAAFYRALPVIPRLIGEALPYLQKHFGEVRLRLELQQDGEHVQLWVKVLVSETATEALDRLHAFDTEWWLDASPRAECHLSFGLEYA